jgi:hypothetical protein
MKKNITNEQLNLLIKEIEKNTTDEEYQKKFKIRKIRLIIAKSLCYLLALGLITLGLYMILLKNYSQYTPKLIIIGCILLLSTFLSAFKNKYS